MKTAITELLNIRYPIIQGGMQRVATAPLVAAVSNAGGLGVLSALTQATPQLLAQEIQRTQALCDKPFAVNLTLLPSLTPPPYEAYVDVIIQSGVKIVETAGRSPEPFMAKFKAAGVLVMHKCTSVKHALKAQAVGCDAVIIDGFEAAGHPGEDDIPSLVLLPRAVDQLDVPVIACGGFSDGRGLVAALSLGAAAMSMGTRFVATQEAPVHNNMKQRLVSASEQDTQLIFRKFRNTARVYKNSVADEVLAIEKRPESEFNDVASLVSGKRGQEVIESGDLEFGIWWAGLSMGLVQDVPTVSALIERIIDEAKQIISQQYQSLNCEP